MTYPAATTPATLHLPAGPDFAPNTRHWCGIPGIELSPGGTLWSTHYTGGQGEGVGNYGVLARSTDGGHTWTDPVAVVEPPAGHRCFDLCLWTDPQGRLWWFWAQVGAGHYDGRPFTWAVVCEDPDAPTPVFGPPRPIHIGIMMNKPTVRRDGEWLLPLACWAGRAEVPDAAPYRYSGCVVSQDAGETFTWRGGADVPNRCFDEHMFVERADGALWVLVRLHDGIGESLSTDGGATWSPGVRCTLPQLDGPNSRFYIRRLDSGRLLLVNHDGHGVERASGGSFRQRSHLTAWLSADDGASWQGGLCLDERLPVSYPDGTQGPDGRIYVTYDYARGDVHWSVSGGGREILMACFTEADVLAGRPGPDTRLRVRISQATA